MVVWAYRALPSNPLQAGERQAPSDPVGVMLHIYEAFVPASSLVLCCPVTLWGKWGVYVLEMQKPMATSCFVVNRVCPQLLQGTFMVPASVEPLP